MLPDRASKTAEHNALFRAIEHHTGSGRLFEDPWAAVFLSAPLRLVAFAARTRPLRSLITRFIDRRWPGVRSSVVARTRLIDDDLTEAIGPADQLVLLGAGFDSRALRLPILQGVDVFEVDHPDTQRLKRGRLRRAHTDSSHIRFVETDFRLSQLGPALAAAGYDPTRPTLFLWEGVTNYLDPDTVAGTLRWCGRAAPGSRLIFTYVDDQLFTNPAQYVGVDRLRTTLRRSGEDLSSGLAPAHLRAYLGEHGLDLDADVGASEYREHYLGEAARAIKGHEFYRVARAHVTAG